MSTGSVKVQDQTLSQTYVLDDDFAGEPTIASLQCDFLLCEADYLRLTTRGLELTDASIAFLLLSVGLALPVVAKQAAAMWARAPANVETWEYWALGFGFFVAIVLGIVSRLVPDEKRTLLKEMKEHFKSNPRQRKVMRRADPS